MDSVTTIIDSVNFAVELGKFLIPWREFFLEQVAHSSKLA